ncbi:hypothetical protein GBN33_02565 [Plesiomonas shigelloides]|nr:hypothetical protein GBN33_02565 [Plesiomonas shigelloides]
MRILKVCFTSMLLFGLGILVHYDAFAHFTDSHWVAQYLQEQGNIALCVLIGFGALFTAVGGPRQVISFIFGYSLGAPFGIILSLFSCLLGSLFAFYMARFTLHHWLHHRFQHRITKLDRAFSKQAWAKILMIRLFPVGNNLLTNLLAGASHIKLNGFLGGTLLGYLPQTIIFAYAGSGIGLDKSENLIISGVLFFISSLIGIYLYRQHRAIALPKNASAHHTNQQG